jgi:hypothetical protein
MKVHINLIALLKRLTEGIGGPVPTIILELNVVVKITVLVAFDEIKY